MRYLSVCSGIEAATVAWQPLGWQAVAFAEIEKFASAVLAHHYPKVSNLGNMTKINGFDFKNKIDVLVGGTPCQSFSVAGLRRGMSDKRGNLTLKFVSLANECDPTFIVWENVPGVLIDRGNAFGCFLAALSGEYAPLLPPGGKWTHTGYVFGPQRTIAWRVLDAQYFGLAQRRKRVFVVASLRGRADPRKILFEFDGLRRDTPPCRETWAKIAGSAASRLGSGGGHTGQGHLSHWSGGPHPALTQSNNTGGIGMSNQELFSQQGAGLVPYIYIPEIVTQAISCKWSKGTSGPAGDEHHNLVAHSLRAQAQSAHDDSLETYIPMAFHGSQDLSVSGDVTHVISRLGVRRLTPRECERLQGFPDDYTNILYRKKSAADGPRYKAIGNSMAVPVMRWIGERIAAYKP